MIILHISTIRKRQGLTQQQLADMTGIKQQMICRFEKGITIPKIDQLSDIMKALKCDWKDLVEVE